ncbi:MAG: hypothetical protein NTV52_18780 [Acidobacteria bacterium]|nr:hypothetical protein [Acidobacteriota bacterium]
MKLASLLLCAASALVGQILVETPTGFQPVGASVSLGVTNPGDPLDTRFRGPAQANIQIGGAGFSARDILPNGDFTVRFLPTADGSYSASLTVAGVTILLRATALATVVVTQAGTALSRGSVIDFGVVEAGVAVEQTLLLENRSTRTLTVSRIETGAKIVNGPALPLNLAAGRSIPLSLEVTPGSVGFLELPLSIDGREFTLRVTGAIPRLPAARIVADAETLRSGQQVRLRIEFAEPARVAGGGTLELAFSGNDPAVRLSTGRTTVFNLPAGSRVARFGEADDIMMQTGTISDTIRLFVRGPGLETVREFRIEPQPVVVDEAKATREGSTIVVAITGFDNSRGAASMNFRFADRAGNPLGSAFTVTPDNEWKSYFQTSGMGGVFRLRAVFPVAGDVSLVGSVTAEIANGVGRTEIGKLTIP